MQKHTTLSEYNREVSSSDVIHLSVKTKSVLLLGHWILSRDNFREDHIIIAFTVHQIQLTPMSTKWKYSQHNGTYKGRHSPEFMSENSFKESPTAAMSPNSNVDM